eukprot:1960389-Amphidinium_carterae.2
MVDLRPHGSDTIAACSGSISLKKLSVYCLHRLNSSGKIVHSHTDLCSVIAPSRYSAQSRKSSNLSVRKLILRDVCHTVLLEDDSPSKLKWRNPFVRISASNPSNTHTLYFLRGFKV